MANLDIDILENFHSSMEGFCLELLHQGYEAMLALKKYDFDWKEDKLTAHYIFLMKELELCKDHQITIIPQLVIYSEEHAFGDEDVEKAPRIDFLFNKWFARNEIQYFAEAKNLCEKDWKKKSGTNVSASYYNNRYISTGITHLLSGYYPSNCVLIGYVLNGRKDGVIENINEIITGKFKDYGVIKKPTSHVNDEYYESKNNVESGTITLKHLLLQLA